MRKVYAFDFDGTLTTSDTFVAFIRFVHGDWRCLLGFLRYSPLLVLMKLGLYPNWKAKQRVFAHFFQDMDYGEFAGLGQAFAKASQGLVRQEVAETLRQAEAEGHDVAIVTASVKEWVQPFFPNATVLATEVEVKQKRGTLTGRFLSKNCYGQEKVNRLLKQYPDRKDYYLTAYGDSRGDKQLLAFADERHYKPFRP